MAFFGSDDISDEDKKEILDKLNEFYYKNKKQFFTYKISKKV